MGNFVIPMHQYIINNDAQAQLLASKAGADPVPYGATVDLSPAVPGSLFSMFGELDWIDAPNLVLLAATERIIEEASAAPVLEESSHTISGTIDSSNIVPAGTVFRVITSEPSLEDVAFQNIPLEKRYQVATKCETAIELAAAINAAIIADSNAIVSSSVASAAVTLTETILGAKSEIFLDALDTEAVVVIVKAIVTIGGVGINNYENLKNIQWANCNNFDRDAQYLPEYNAKYTSFYFKVKATVLAEGGHATPSKESDVAVTEYMWYVKEGTAFETAMKELVIDMNV